MTQDSTGAASIDVYKTELQTSAAVSRRIDEMAATIIEKYRGKNPLFICLLRGGAPFTAKLMFAIAERDPHFHPEVDYMTIRTYGDERSGKQSELVMPVSPSTVVKDRHVILLDDVLDMGFTATFATAYAASKGAATTELVVLVQKQVDRETYPTASLFGFEAPEAWLTGMGMDDARITKEGNRWMTNLAIANDAD